MRSKSCRIQRDIHEREPGSIVFRIIVILRLSLDKWHVVSGNPRIANLLRIIKVALSID